MSRTNGRIVLGAGLGLAAGLALASGAASAQDMGAMSMPGMAPTAGMAAPEPSATPAAAAKSSSAPTTQGAGRGMPGTDMSVRAAGDGMSAMPMGGMDMGSMKGDLGAYSMARDASGTAWQPDSSPMEGLHRDIGGWATMLHGYATLVYDNQGGARGANKTFSESMLMGMAQHAYGGGVLTLRSMLSLDPLMGKAGYPLLLATGETADGRTALIDRQHPHDLVMELAGVYSHPIAPDTSAFLYAGWPGEPALGPVTFMHRFSGAANPEAPIDHHWLDSTHITFGVVTAGLVRGPFKLEASSFTGREPNQNRYDFDHPRMDSWSGRLSWNPSRDWSLQVSGGHLTSPEQLDPTVNQDRVTASASYNRPLPMGTWQTTLAWGRDINRPGHTLDAVLAESTAALGPHTVFVRAEAARKDELFDNDPTNPLYRRVFDVAKYSMGYFYTVPLTGAFAVDVGGLVSRYTLPATLDATYGSDPTSFMLFTRVKIR